MTANPGLGKIYPKLRAIMADDEAVARRLLKRNLQRSAPYVEVIGEASNGRELLALLEATTADILMLDIMMPGLNGLEALRQLEGKAKDMKVVIVSAHDRFDFAREALSLGVFDYLLKPVRPNELMATISKCALKIEEERAKDVSAPYANFQVGTAKSRCSDADEFFVLESKLVNEVKAGSLQRALEVLKELVERAAVAACGNGFLGLELATATTGACKAAAELAGGSESMLALRNLTVQKLVQSRTVREMAGVAKDCLKMVFESIGSNGSCSQRLILSAQAIIEERACENLALGDVAREVFVSPWYLSRLFKATCGVSFQDYLTRVRIDKAKALLRDTDMSCKAIGQMVGYSSASYFSQVFKRSVGMSPGEFRRTKS